jgi:hypothetical protein
VRLKPHAFAVEEEEHAEENTFFLVVSHTACIARRGRRSSRHPNEGGRWEPSVTFACIFVLVVDSGRSRRYRRSCGNGWVVLARNVSRGGSRTEGSPGESSLYRARCSRMVLAGNVGRRGKVIMARRAYSHQVWGSPTVSLNRGVRGGSLGSWGSINGEGGGSLTGGPLLLDTILYY